MILLEQLERDTLAERHVAAVLMAAGAKDVTLPDLQAERERFDAALVQAPQTAAALSPEDAERADLLRALGLT